MTDAERERLTLKHFDLLSGEAQRRVHREVCRRVAPYYRQAHSDRWAAGMANARSRRERA